MRHPALRAALLACAFSAAAHAQGVPSYSVHLGPMDVTPSGLVCITGSIAAPCGIAGNPLVVSGGGSPGGTASTVAQGAAGSAAWPVTDINSAAFQGVVAITPGTATTALRSLGFIVTTAGNVTLTLADSSTITLALAASPQFQTLPFAVTNVALGSGTAGTFWNLK